MIIPLLWLVLPLAAFQTDREPDKLIARYDADRRSLVRYYDLDSPARRKRMEQFTRDWIAQLGKVDFDGLNSSGRIDYVMFRDYLEHELRMIELIAQWRSETEPIIPFAQNIVSLEESRRKMETMDAKETAAKLTLLVADVEKARKASAGPIKDKRIAASRAGRTLASLRATLKTWYGYYDGYDPLFTWWVAQPYKDLDKALEEYEKVLRPPKDEVVGNPIGRQMLLNELAYEMVPYTPEELVAIANKEFAWCDREMLKASRELGFGDDWKKALEHVKNLHVEPGKQPELIRDLAREAEKFLDDHDLVTVPPLVRETWRMQMMSPERQLVNPFFLGGESIIVSYPTSTMTNDRKLASMRGNNIHFSRATVFHELIPGHNLQGFMAARYRPYRNLFGTPFLTEGWSLYWEMLLWDMGFQKSAEDRVGALFWRMHRCARIIFSLNFHLGKMTPKECIDFLVDRVGFERDNAEGEVRRSFAGGYSPLYQAAYLLGGLQIRALRRELVETGKMTNRQFHDAILQENRIPIEMMRAALTGAMIKVDFKPSWKFYGENP